MKKGVAFLLIEHLLCCYINIFYLILLVASYRWDIR